MAVAQTKAASYIQEHTEEISSHHIISLLMEGALERIDQAVEASKNKHLDDLLVLTDKLIAIINGLRNSLNMKVGGDIAVNLEGLYHYMVERITESTEKTIVASLEEVYSLLSEVKKGWDQMDLSVAESPMV